MDEWYKLRLNEEIQSLALSVLDEVFHFVLYLFFGAIQLPPPQELGALL